MKAVVFLAGIVFFSFFPCMSLYASEEAEPELSYVDDWLASCDLSAVNEGMDSLFPGITVDAGELLEMVIQGNAGEAFQMLTAQVKDSLAGELSGLKQVLIYILVFGVISAVFSEFSDLFAGQQIAQAGFYFLYLFLMALLTKVFLFMSDTVSAAVENIVLFIKLFIPTYFMAVGAASGTAAAVFYYQMMLVIAWLVESILQKVLIPFIYSYVILALLNGLWTEEKLTLLLDFIEKGIGFALKASMGAVTGLSLVQAVIVPVAGSLKISAMRKALSAIPGIGGVTEGVAELMLGSAVLLKNSMGVLLLLLLLGALLLPLLKVLIVAGIVKLGAAVAGIVSDKRVSGCADRVGTGGFLLFKCLLTSAALFIIVIAVVSVSVSP
ncbi:MAG: stage III sporulation protein AE [Clostridium sp.]|nr:stage III sporulation protein AE [Clostridium sp.]